MTDETDSQGVVQDENFDHLLQFMDAESQVYKEIVLRREKYLSISRLTMQLVGFFSFVLCLWIVLITRNWWFLGGVAIFFIITVGNAQILNYRALLPTNPFKKEEKNE
jgi:hypothetical protein